ncbi:H-NS histone family protein [Ralstonia pseudosolanacearum]|uniref:H-NS histone family protein n=1 Tax=Ralstonia pseudosolanacearum TaxID=1310165 RepID=UPI0008F9529D|nr:H-NS histone family protein [Ralstonia pseudosolanacearum]MCK4165386.1 H-NS histone family protein [Ralstonia pseudosolanacearum]OIN68871.1 hypothetical protein BL248_22675 [Ralstonia solanacearum]
MQEFQQIDAQIAHCEQEIAALAEAKNILQAQRGEILQRAREQKRPALMAVIEELGFRPEDLFEIAKKAKPDENAPKKYRDPETGELWSGKGNEPKWIAGKDKKQFLNPAWEEHKNKKKGSGKSTSTDPKAEANQDMAQDTSAVQVPASVSAAPQTIVAVTAAPETPISQNEVSAANTAQDPVSVSAPAIPTVATTTSVDATLSSEASTVNVTVVSTPASAVPTTDSGSQPMAIAA